MLETLEALDAVFGLLSVLVGVVWMAFGKPRNVKINGVLVPPFYQGLARLVAPLVWWVVLHSTVSADPHHDQ